MKNNLIMNGFEQQCGKFVSALKEGNDCVRSEVEVFRCVKGVVQVMNALRG